MSEMYVETGHFEVPNIILDEDAGKILAATYASPKSAKRISKLCNIPIATCFKRIRDLERVGLLICACVVYDHRGKGIKLYQSQLNGVYLSLLGERVKGHFKLASDLSQKMISRGS